MTTNLKEPNPAMRVFNDKRFNTVFENAKELNFEFIANHPVTTKILEFFNYLNDHIDKVKDKSTGRKQRLKSPEAEQLFGIELSSLFYEVMYKITPTMACKKKHFSICLLMSIILSVVAIFSFISFK
jgi:hypothetical protein